MPNDPWTDRADLDEPDNAHLDALARSRCTLCDPEGYRPNGAVCDHVDRTEIAKRGIAKCRAALSKLPKS